MYVDRRDKPGHDVDTVAPMSTSVSPLAPTDVPDMPAIAGVRLATAQAGIRYANRTDVLLALFDEGTTVAGVFTRSKCPSAPVEWCRARLNAGKARALVVNSGNANAFTGKTGRASTKLTADITAKAVGCKTQRNFPRLDRRDRRTARRHQVRPGDGRPGRTTRSRAASSMPPRRS